jgi:hypothetical protein
MTALTANLILQKTRLDNLGHVRKLNACGVQVEDISVLGSTPNLEVCSLSANCISNLTPLVECSRLTELYLRKNDVRELHQVLYLAGASQLRTLNLASNPICDHPHYRGYTIAALTSLQLLDDEPITPEERRSAEMKFPDILEDIRSLSIVEGSPTAAMTPQADSREPSSARMNIAPRQLPSPARQPRSPERSKATAAGSRYNGDDVPIGSNRVSLRRAQSDVMHSIPVHSKAAQPQPRLQSAAQRERPGLVPVEKAVRRQPLSAKDAAMATAVTTLLDEMSPEAIAAVRDHMVKMGL